LHGLRPLKENLLQIASVNSPYDRSDVGSVTKHIYPKVLGTTEN